jgi:putative acetyltransferase
LPSTKAYIIARFRNRQDAHDHLRVLHRFIPSATFEIVFDIPDEEEPNEQA